MKEKISQYTLYVVIVGIIVGVYTETGFFTSLFAIVVVIAIHNDRKMLRKITDILKDIVAKLPR